MFGRSTFYLAAAGDPPPAGGAAPPPVAPPAAPPVPPAGAPPAADTVETLRARLAALEADKVKSEAAAATAATAAAATAEADRVAKLTAEQKVAENLAAQRAELDGLRAGVVSERRNLALDRAGVADKFRAYAPQVDPATPDGAKALEAWVKANPELCRPGGGPALVVSPLDALKSRAGSALSQVLAGTRKSTLVTERNLSKLT